MKDWFKKLCVQFGIVAKVIISEHLFVGNNQVSEGARPLACEPFMRDGLASLDRKASGTSLRGFVKGRNCPTLRKTRPTKKRKFFVHALSEKNTVIFWNLFGTCVFLLVALFAGYGGGGGCSEKGFQSGGFGGYYPVQKKTERG